MTNPAEQVVRPIDRFQQSHKAAGFVFGVIKKFGDDRGGALSALITFYGFLSIFPLLLVAVTVLGFALSGNPHLEHQVKTSFLGEIPLVGQQLQDQNGLSGSGLGLVVGLLGLLYGSLGASQAIQFAINEAWDVPNKNRPNFFVRLARGLTFYTVLGTGVVATTVLSSLGAIVGSSQLAGVVGLAAALAVNIGLFLVVFRLLGPKHLTWRHHIAGAVIAGLGWQVLQSVAQRLVQHNLKNTQPLYGQFAIALGLISFLSIASQLTMYSAEVNVVRYKRLWPRSILQPPLLEADRRALAMRATQEERRHEQLVDVSWDDVEDQGPSGGKARDTQARDTQARDTQARDTQARDTQARDTQALAAPQPRGSDDGGGRREGPGTGAPVRPGGPVGGSVLTGGSAGPGGPSGPSGSSSSADVPVAAAGVPATPSAGPAHRAGPLPVAGAPSEPGFPLRKVATVAAASLGAIILERRLRK